MDRIGYREAYRRHLPHLQPSGVPLFLTMRLHGSLPAEAVERLRSEAAQLTRELAVTADPTLRAARERAANRERFRRIESNLDGAGHGPTWLREPTVAKVVRDSLHHGDGTTYQLHAYAVMANHVHAVLTPLPVGPDLTPAAMSRVLHSVKSFTATQANRLLDRSGPFWEHESYDHWIRDDAERERCISYVIGNPVKAGLVDDWRDYPWCWAAP